MIENLGQRRVRCAYCGKVHCRINRKDMERRWGTKKHVQELFGVPPSYIIDLTSRGAVRTAKLGDSPAATRLYSLRDLERELNNLAKAQKQ